MPFPESVIISIGDELLYGQTLDTNSHWISEKLTLHGFKVVHRMTIPDQKEMILEAFEVAQSKADIVLITGGLGPTEDDLTKDCLAEYFNCGIKEFPEALEQIKNIFEKRGRELSTRNLEQAQLPEICDQVSNTLGTAPGMWFDEEGKVMVSMPGVPYEMEKMMEDTVIPRLKKRFKAPNIYHKIIKTVGIGESRLAEIIEPWEKALPKEIGLAYLPGLAEVKLRLTATGDDRKALEQAVSIELDRLQKYAWKYIYGYDEDTLPEVLGRLLVAQNKTLALAESCTGGYASHLITSAPGSSKYYQGSIVPYHNHFKRDLLGVSEGTLLRYGAVSEGVVIEMAEHVKEMYRADFGLALSGVAGPSGGSKEKPVGTVWIAVATKEKTLTKKLQLYNDREINIKAASVSVLNMLRRILVGIS